MLEVWFKVQGFHISQTAEEFHKNSQEYFFYDDNSLKPKQGRNTAYNLQICFRLWGLTSSRLDKTLVSFRWAFNL